MNDNPTIESLGAIVDAAMEKGDELKHRVARARCPRVTETGNNYAEVKAYWRWWWGKPVGKYATSQERSTRAALHTSRDLSGEEAC